MITVKSDVPQKDLKSYIQKFVVNSYNNPRFIILRTYQYDSTYKLLFENLKQTLARSRPIIITFKKEFYDETTVML